MSTVPLDFPVKDEEGEVKFSPKKLRLENEQSEPPSTEECPSTSTAPPAEKKKKARRVLKVLNRKKNVDEGKTKFQGYQQSCVSLFILSDNEFDIVSETDGQCVSPDEQGEDDSVLRLNHLVMQHIKRDEFLAALTLCRDHLRIHQYGDDINKANILKILASIYKNIYNYSHAANILTRALASYEKLLGENHPIVPRTLTNLAVLQKLCGLTAQALVSSRKALFIKEDLYGGTHPNIVKQLYNVAVLNHIQYKHNIAEECYQRALHISQNQAESGDPSVTQIKHNLAAAFRSQKKHDRIAELLE